MSRAIAGFADPNIVLIALLFVLGEGLVRTGVARRLVDWINVKAQGSEIRLVVLLMASVAIAGSIMSSTAIVAIFRQPRGVPSMSREQGSRIEQRTVKISISVVLAIVVGSLGYGFYIESQAVILNGIFSILSLVSGGMSLLAAKLVMPMHAHAVEVDEGITDGDLGQVRSVGELSPVAYCSRHH